MSQWGSSDSGILRKKKVDENLDQLLVFGYSCKIFKDDEKALYIDQGKHLIPWMGEEALKIDRYDGRGTLPDLKQFEASREGYDALRWLGLSESEKKLEELCDSERYYSLEINEEEEEMYKEEASKRQKTNTFAFDYNNPQPAPLEKEAIPTVPEKEEEDEPYKPSPVLDVPVDINIPKTLKEYARIEKTALFVCRQGPQMEILIKAKQADNPQFRFLVVQDPLYKFYRHLLSAFKNGRYQPQCDKKSDEPKTALSQEEDQNSHYLHPSLVSPSAKPNTPPSQNPPIPSVPYRPSADCSYSQLVNRIQGTGLGNVGQSEIHGMTVTQQQSQIQVINQMSLEQQYHQYYYVQQFYEYWRHSVITSEQGAMYAGLPLEFSQLDPNMQSYIHQLAWAQFVQHHQKQIQETQQAQANSSNNSYAQIVSNLSKDGVNPYTVNVPQLPPLEMEKEQKILTSEKIEEKTVTLVKYEENEVKKSLLSLAAAYGSGSDSDSDTSGSEPNSGTAKQLLSEQEIEVYRVPSGEIQTVIDKMAEYVSKNGRQFEEIIKQKGDSRFDFLREGHEFNKYYRAQLGRLQGEPLLEESKKAEEPKPPKSKSKKVIAPVSFSIKKPKDEAPKEIKSALPVEDSSEEDECMDSAPKSPSSVTTNNNSTAQKVSPNQKIIYKIGQPVVTTLHQTKVVQLTVDHEGNSVNDAAFESKENNVSSIIENHSSKIGSKSPLILLAPSTRRPRTPKKRSRSPTKSPVRSKRAKSRSKTPKRTKESPIKSMRLSSTEEQKSHLKNKKSVVIDMFEIRNDEDRVTGKAVNGALEKDDPILEMMELESYQKSADEKAADAKEKARQLERKRKAAMFLKLKSVESRPSITQSTIGKIQKKSEKNSEANSRRSTSSSVESRRNSDDSIVTIRSRSRTREKSKLNEKLPRRKSRSKSKEINLLNRRSRSKDGRKHKRTRDKDISRSKDEDDEKKRRKDKKKKTHKRKHSKSKRKSKKHKRFRSASQSASRSRSISRSSSVKSHISIDSS